MLRILQTIRKRLQHNDIAMALKTLDWAVGDLEEMAYCRHCKKYFPADYMAHEGVCQDCEIWMDHNDRAWGEVYAGFQGGLF